MSNPAPCQPPYTIIFIPIFAPSVIAQHRTIALVGQPKKSGMKCWTRPWAGLRVGLLREEYSSGISLHPVLASSTEQGARKKAPWRVL